MKTILTNILYFPSSQTENLGLGSIAAYLRKNNHEVILNCIHSEDIKNGEYIKLFQECGLCGFTIYSMNAELVFTVANGLKKAYPKISICVGGFLATICAKQILKDCPSIDFIVLGDGEQSMLDAVVCLKTGGDLSLLPHVVTRYDTTEKKADVIDITELTPPARDNMIHSLRYGNTIAQISGSRGCCAHCTFCSANYYAPKWRGRPVEAIYKEICSINKKYGIKCFMFNDASLEDPGNLGIQRLHELCDRLIAGENHFAFRCFFRGDSLTNQNDLLKKLRKAGFVQTFVGLEAANEKDLVIYGKKATVAQNKISIQLFRQNDIDVLIGFIMLNPYSTRESIRTNYLFLRDIRAFSYGNYISRIELDYDTVLYNRMLLDDLIKETYDYKHPFEYRFCDEYVDRTNAFLQGLDGVSDIMSADFEFNAAMQIVNNLKAICPHKSADDRRKFLMIREKISDELANYFSLVYLQQDLERALQEWPGFVHRITELYAAAKRISMRLIIHNKDLQTY